MTTAMGLNRRLIRAVHPTIDLDQYDREVIAEWFTSEEGSRVMAGALQRFQDHTYLDENNHRYHCGGSEYPHLRVHVLAVLSEREATE